MESFVSNFGMAPSLPFAATIAACSCMILLHATSKFKTSLLISAVIFFVTYQYFCLSVLVIVIAVAIFFGTLSTSSQARETNIADIVRDTPKEYLEGAEIRKLNNHEVLITRGRRTIIFGSEQRFDPSTGHGKYYVREVGQKSKYWTSPNAGRFGKTQEQAAINIIKERIGEESSEPNWNWEQYGPRT